MKVNSFFCGAGGFDLGFIQAGFEIAGAWDFDKYVVESYKRNIGGAKQTNVLDMTYHDLNYSDVWIFGAPCQAFSVAGRQLGMMFKCPSCFNQEQFDGEQIIDRNTPCSLCGKPSEPKDIRGVLFFEIMRLLKETNTFEKDNLPPYILLENVKGISKFIEVIRYEYEKRGYDLVYTLYNSKYWGVPQNRERYFLLGIRKDLNKSFVFPEQQTGFIPKLSSVLESEVDEKYYIDDLKAAKIIEEAMEGLRVKQATKKGYDIAVEGDSINISHPNSKTRRGRVGKQVAQTLLTGTEQVVVMASRGRYNEEGKVEQNYELNSEGITNTLTSVQKDNYLVEQPKIEMLDMKGNETVRRVYDPEGLAPTLTTSEGGHRQPKLPQYRVRKLTPREYARLQGFPESYEQVVSNSQFYKQMGNAVTVNVAYAIAKAIKEQFE